MSLYIKASCSVRNNTITKTDNSAKNTHAHDYITDEENPRELFYQKTETVYGLKKPSYRKDNKFDFYSKLKKFIYSKYGKMFILFVIMLILITLFYMVITN